MNNKLFVIFSLLSFCFFSCTTSKPIDNTFLSTIDNESNFTIMINEIEVMSGVKAEHKFPLHINPLHDGETVQYEIPLTEDVSYIMTDKILIADNQKSVVIENPKSTTVSECYVIIQNNSNETIQITNSTNKIFFECCLKGIINGRNSLTTHNIAMNTEVVCKIGIDQTELYAYNSINSSKAKPIRLNIPFKKGYVYKILIENNKAILTDCRPLLQLYEKSWEQEYKNAIILSAIQKDGNIYCLGTETGKDRLNNSYKTGFIKCFDMQGKQRWLQPYDVKGTDTYLYDMVFDSDGTIEVVGQSIGTNMTGLLLKYNEDGELIQNITVSEAIGLDMITPRNDGSLLLHGYDRIGNPIYFKVDPNRLYLQSRALYDSNQTSHLVQSESKIIEDKSGNIYVAGETSYLERPSAIIVCVPNSGSCKVAYTAREPFSFVSDMILNEEENQLVFVGTLNAKDNYGNGGTPFIRCLDLITKEILWETIYLNCGYEVCAKISKCEDYGYILIFANSNEDGNVSLPCKVMRTNATGR